MILDQSIDQAVTGATSGQTEKNHTGSRKNEAAILMLNPNLPKDHLRIVEAEVSRKVVAIPGSQW